MSALDFWQFIHERMTIWRARGRGEPAPWTSDRVLRSVHFTNIFRELDPGTFVAVDIMSRDEPAWVRAWNLLLYRRLNRESTWRAIGGFKRRPRDWAGPAGPVSRRLEMALRAAPRPIFTGAHEVSMMQAHKWLGADMFERQANMMAMYESIKAWTRAVEKSESARDAFDATVGVAIPGVGKFLAWQLTLDMRYGPRPIGKYSDDEWAPAQMGSLNGLREIYNIHSYNAKDYMADMLEHQDDHFGSRDLSMATFHPYDRLTWAALEHALCEYSKYARAWRGGHSKVKFDGEGSKKSR